MLNQASEHMPEAEKENERFEIPKVKGHVEGSKTILTNFFAIAQHLDREFMHFNKYILKELAISGFSRGSNYILGGKVSSVQINEKIRKYADTFVFCPHCGKPETTLKREESGTTLVCNACGQEKVIKDIA